MEIYRIARAKNVHCVYEGNGVFLICPNGLELRGNAKACLRYLEGM